MSSEEAKTFGIDETERKQYVREDNGKVNIIRGGGNPKWFRLVGVSIGNKTELYPSGDEVQTTEMWKPPELWADISSITLNQMLTKIDEGPGNGNKYTDGPNAGDRAAWRVVAGLAPTKTEKQAQEVIKQWVKSGLLVRCEYPNPDTRKIVRGLKVDHSKRPSA
jgi:hypothetical protein